MTRTWTWWVWVVQGDESNDPNDDPRVYRTRSEAWDQLEHLSGLGEGELFVERLPVIALDGDLREEAAGNNLLPPAGTPVPMSIRRAWAEWYDERSRGMYRECASLRGASSLTHSAMIAGSACKSMADELCDGSLRICVE